MSYILVHFPECPTMSYILVHFCWMSYKCPTYCFSSLIQIFIFSLFQNFSPTMNGGEFKCIFSHLRRVNFKIFSNHGELFLDETKQETYYSAQKAENVTDSRTARVDDKKPVSWITQKLVQMKDSYLLHRKYVDNDRFVWQALRNAHTGKFLHRDYSENMNISEKHQVQDAHFSGKQYTLHCSSLETPNPYKYIYHLSDNTTHAIDTVLDDIFVLQKIRNEAVLIKTDNAPTQYKNKYAFGSYQHLAGKFNCTIVKAYGAAGHGKGLVDTMSAFGVKSILRRAIVGKDKFWANSEEICDFLSCLIDDDLARKHREMKDGLKINGCVKNQLFVFKPNQKPLVKQFFCDCEKCLNFEFHMWKRWRKYIWICGWKRSRKCRK